MLWWGLVGLWWGVGGAVVGVSDVLFTVLIVQFPMTSLREIRILQLLNHENIMPLVEICRAKGMSDHRLNRLLARDRKRP